MKVCSNCGNAVSNGGKCTEQQGFDGYYTHATPIFLNDELYKISAVTDSMSAPSVDKYGNPICISFVKI